jgi:hypothetical protein
MRKATSLSRLRDRERARIMIRMSTFERVCNDHVITGDDIDQRLRERAQFPARLLIDEPESYDIANTRQIERLCGFTSATFGVRGPIGMMARRAVGYMHDGDRWMMNELCPEAHHFVVRVRGDRDDLTV